MGDRSEPRSTPSGLPEWPKARLLNQKTRDRNVGFNAGKAPTAQHFPRYAERQRNDHICLAGPATVLHIAGSRAGRDDSQNEMCCLGVLLCVRCLMGSLTGFRVGST
jgi:hypothetical protein